MRVIAEGITDIYFPLMRRAVPELFDKQPASQLVDGFLIHYDFFRPHMTLHHKTPAEVAGIGISIRTWEDVVRYA